MMPLGSSTSTDTVKILFFLALGLIVAIGLLNSRDRGQKGRLRRVADRVGGTFRDGGLISEHRIDFAIGGYGASLQFFAGARGSPPHTWVLLDLRRQSPGTLHILKDGFARSFLKIFGAQDLSVGDAAFDKEYVIKAVPESLAARIFSPERRPEVVRTVRRLHGFADPSFDLDPHHLSVGVRQYLRDEEALMTLITAATEFFGHVTVLSTQSGVVLGEVNVAGEGMCPVCGTLLREPLAHCERCRLSYHAACWAYMGRCATDACRGTRARA